MRWNRSEVSPVDDAVCLKFFEGTAKHLLGHTLDQATELTEPLRTVYSELPEHQELPSASDDRQRRVQTAVVTPGSVIASPPAGRRRQTLTERGTC